MIDNFDMGGDESRVAAAGTPLLAAIMCHNSSYQCQHHYSQPATVAAELRLYCWLQGEALQLSLMTRPAANNTVVCVWFKATLCVSRQCHTGWQALVLWVLLADRHVAYIIGYEVRPCGGFDH